MDTNVSAAWLPYACLALGLATGLVGGVFQAFSDFIMRSLSAARPTSGMEAMQLVNRKVYRFGFLTMFLALAPVSIGLAIYAQAASPSPAAAWTAFGAALYIVTVFATTVARNVPMNKRLDGMSPDAADGHAYWAHYRVAWTRWNHLRTAGSIAAAACFLLAALAAAAG